MTGDWWRPALAARVDGRRVIVAGGPAAFWTAMVATLRHSGAADVLVVATEGTGAGPQPDARTVVVEADDTDDVMARLRAGVRTLADPPPAIVDAVESFDPDRSAVVFGSFLAETPTLCDRALVAHRRPEWVALEDKTHVDALLDRAGIARAPSMVVPVAEAVDRWPELDRGLGTMWAADATEGYHGGGALTRWVVDHADAERIATELGRHARSVRVMPFLDGIATSMHGIVLPDGVAALRPVELVTLRHGRTLRYSGCATFWDPPDAMRAEMRDATRRLGETLRDEVDFRGSFTLDGIATVDGFRPTELNPRFGAGLGVITRGLADLPLHLVLDLVVAGDDIGIAAADLEHVILAEADARRSGGTWQLEANATIELDGRGASLSDGEWHWTDERVEPPDAIVLAKSRFARATFDPDRTPVGASVGERAVAFWRFMDAGGATAIGLLTAPLDVAAAGSVRWNARRPPSTRP